jgi:hypothetical protein
MSVTIEPERTVTHHTQSARWYGWHQEARETLINFMVSKEATRLDRLFPGWEGRVNINTLDIASARNCILGQAAYKKVLFWRFSIGFGQGEDIVENDAAAGGGETFDEAYFSNYTRHAWINEIHRRFA